MTAMGRVRRLSLLVAFPLALLHELAHYLAALPWADDSVILIDPAGGAASAYVDFRADSPPWAIALASLFPTIVGSLLATATLVWWGLEGLATPGDLMGWMRLSIAALSWGVFSWPSPEDIDSARNGAPEGGSGDATPGVRP